MTSYLQIENLTKSYGDRLLFTDVTFGVNQGDKIGLIAKNGTGKTTLLRIIAGLESPDSGTVTFRNDLRVGYINQLPDLPEKMTVIDACLNSNAPACRAISAYEAALASGDPDAITSTMAQMDAENAWDYDDRLKQMLHQLRITDPAAIVGNLSGGQKKRIAIARVLLDNPDLIILDEPTNHLDIDIIEWLEEYLRRQNVTLLMVTHDRYFLDAVCTKIIEIDRQTIFTYNGDYDYYIRRRAERIEAMGAELAKVKNTLRKEQEWMRRQPQARAGKAKYRIDVFYDLKERSRVNLSERNVNIGAFESSYIGSKIFEAKHIAKRFGDKVILDDFNYIFARYEKLGIIGRNGVGKSTLIKMLLGLVAPDSGSWDVGTTVRFGYYSQDGMTFDPDKKVIDAVTEKAEEITTEGGLSMSPMQFLTRFLFSPADQQKYIHTLSGGEKARLHLATVLMQRPNFLILDEPTNDLDILSLGLLEEYLRDFSGCLIVISHDRFFLDSIVDHIWVLEGNGAIKDFPGNYSDYRRWLKERASDIADRSERKESASRQAKEQQRPRRLSYREQKELDALTEEIDALNQEKHQLDELFNSGTPLDNVAELSDRYRQITDALDEKELRWLELSEISEQ
ncbi:MAG: ABC-F family ATP-binding cassette domain-containing protein [Bacteroides sp.]|nr:ABC-F family ATP-binding cassette domain-containing protein [Bacteroides sp.]MCM1412732.1 ABC-F family ATP-binding cassette domain-containing protein [Bacteroides sp.]MCM1470974.1 ABC-F family ATP-binding cassette domain-containing protein [Bacteroides sp.]